MAAMYLSISKSRATVMEYLLPAFITSSIDVLYRKEDLDDSMWLLLLQPFKPTVFLMFLVAVIAALLLFGVIELHERHYMEKQKTQRKAAIFLNIFCFILGSSLRQGIIFYKKNQSLYLLVMQNSGQNVQ